MAQKKDTVGRVMAHGGVDIAHAVSVANTIINGADQTPTDTLLAALLLVGLDIRRLLDRVDNNTGK